MEKNLRKNSLSLRPYRKSDAQYIVNWCKDEISFRNWCADRYETFPITPDDMNRQYTDLSDDIDGFYPMTAVDENGIVGHMIMRFTDNGNQALRFGFVIVDDMKRGRGYGKEMLSLALKYAFEILKVGKVTLGVFENNIPAYRCYKSVGFQNVEQGQDEYYKIGGENRRCVMMEVTKCRN
ncbi:MAG: GNAT family N-acetyltransferase [Lachnospiraceae bacterium]|nr:GNAT family N-acetyltransferase [Lachnospiraceae bacterium]